MLYISISNQNYFFWKIQTSKYQSFLGFWSTLMWRYYLVTWIVDIHILIFRTIFDLSNKIALLILLRMFALYVKNDKNWKWVKMWCYIWLIFRAIFDLSNKIAFLILLRMYALYVKSNLVMTKFEIVYKEWYFGSTQLNSAWLSSTLLKLARLILI